jgi:pSer/pThr/pTyr-binding forkhead associated (FHA) protein
VSLVVREPKGLAGTTYTLTDELTMGRAPGCHITLDDTYVSQVHARVFMRDGKVMIEDLGSTNGTYHNRAKVGAPVIVNRGDRVQAGSVVMELV